MGWLFDTDAISELWRPRPASRFLTFVAGVGRDEQFTSAVVIGELYRGAFRSPRKAHFEALIDHRVVPLFRVLAYDTDVARVYGATRAALEADGVNVADADLQIAATAVWYDLTVVTGNVRHFALVPGLRIRDLRG